MRMAGLTGSTKAPDRGSIKANIVNALDKCYDSIESLRSAEQCLEPTPQAIEPKEPPRNYDNVGILELLVVLDERLATIQRLSARLHEAL